MSVKNMRILGVCFLQKKTCKFFVVHLSPQTPLGIWSCESEEHHKGLSDFAPFAELRMAAGAAVGKRFSGRRFIYS